MNGRPLVVVLGPTASGKTDLALSIARRVGGEIVSADAFAVYRGFDVGTAKPAIEIRREIPHHLVDVASPFESFTAGRWADAARVAIRDIESRGRVPIVAGGSHFYVRALLTGLPGTEVACPPLRRHFAGVWGPSVRRSRKRMLDVLDPAYGARVPPGDTARISRALEIIFVTGRRVSERTPSTDSEPERRRTLMLALQISRQDIYTRVEGRVSAMWQSGWAREVENLRHAGVTLAAPAFRAIGYREIASAAAGECTLDEALRRTISRTRALAKRQATWLASEPELERLPFEAAVERAVSFVREGTE